MDQFDIFETLNVTMPEKTSKQKKSERKTQKNSEETYPLPLTLYTGYHEPIELNDEQKKELSKKELAERIAASIPAYTGCLYRYDKKSAGIYAYFNPDTLITKGSIIINPDTKMMLGANIFDISGISPDENHAVDISVLSDIVTDKIPLLKGEHLSFYHILEANIIIPRIPKKDVGKNASFPVTVLLPERGMLQISKEMCKEAGITADIPNTECLIQTAQKQWPELAQGFGVYHTGNVAILFPEFAPDSSPDSGKELIPVSGTAISLLFRKIVLTPDMFDGAESVSKDDIIRLLSREYPEYSKSRTEIIYDEASHLIIPVLKGSKKGAGLIPVLEDPGQMQEYEREFLPYYKLEHGQQIRVENTPVARFQKGHDNVTFQYHLPEIPGSIYAKCLSIFTEIMFRQNTEAMLQLFYDIAEERYFLYFPWQNASYAQVCIERNYTMEQKYLLVMDMHSHGRINCSFSRTDDEDEQGTRFYCVFYNLAHEPACDIRCGCAGSFSPVRIEELFDIFN